jgi:hypothetical protein
VLLPWSTWPIMARFWCGLSLMVESRAKALGDDSFARMT